MGRKAPSPQLTERLFLVMQSIFPCTLPHQAELTQTTAPGKQRPIPQIENTCRS